MKNLRLVILLLISTFVLSSCIKTNWSNGTKLLTIVGTDYNDTWEETYTYNDQGQIVEINDYRSLGRRYEMEYNDGKLLQYRTYRIDNNNELFRDSFGYDVEGRIKEIYGFSINSGPDLPLNYIDVFEYDGNGNVIEKKTYRAGEPEPLRTEMYHWDGDKIEKVDEYYDGELAHEWYYKYDGMKNYKKDIPIKWYNPLNWQDHNIKHSEVKDHTGMLDLLCYSCKTKYQYNLDGYPVKITTEWGKEIELVYE